MKNLTKVNGSDITANERETSERRFIRYYSLRDDKPTRYILWSFISNKNRLSLVVDRYFELIEKHGNLKPLVDIKIRAPYLAQVQLVYNQITQEKEIDLRQTVQQFKKYLGQIFHIPFNRLRLFHLDSEAFNMGIAGPEELKYPQRILHT